MKISACPGRCSLFKCGEQCIPSFDDSSHGLLFAGDKVSHDEHGVGIVQAVNFDSRHGKPFHIRHAHACAPACAHPCVHTRTCMSAHGHADSRMARSMSNQSLRQKGGKMMSTLMQASNSLSRPPTHYLGLCLGLLCMTTRSRCTTALVGPSQPYLVLM